MKQLKHQVGKTPPLPLKIDQSDPSLVFVPGIGLNENLFDRQTSCFTNSRVLDLPIPLEDESISEYCNRWANQLDFEKPFILIGFAFGGILARELSKFITPDAIVLISSCLSSNDFPQKFKNQHLILEQLESGLLKPLLKGPGLNFLKSKESLDKESVAIILSMIDNLNIDSIRWFSEKASAWNFENNSFPEAFTTYQIHGDKDWLFPIGSADIDFRINDAGHLLPLTHFADVNESLNRILSIIKAVRVHREKV